MDTTPGDVKRPKAKRLLIATALLALFAFFLPLNAEAACCVTSVVTDTTTTPAVSAFQSIQTAMLAGINAIFSGVLAVLTWLQNTLLPATIGAISSAVTSSGMLISDMLTKHGDYVVNNVQSIHQQHLTAEQQAHATVSNQSMACAVQALIQAKEQMYQNSNGIKGSFTALVALGECKGVNASCSGANRVKERFYDLCYLGYLPLQKYGDLLSKVPGGPCNDISTQTGGQRYIDAQSNINILFDSYEFPAAQGCILPDGYPYFSGRAIPGMSTTCQGGTSLTVPAALTGDPTKDPMAWIAAYKYCEGLTGPPKTPITTQNRAITILDMQKVLDDTQDETMNLSGSPKELCLHYLWERTAFPSSAGGGAGQATAVGGDTANSDQMTVCKLLQTGPNQTTVDRAGTNGPAQPLPVSNGTGMGIDNDPLVNDCASNNSGLSPLAELKAEQHGCGAGTQLSAIASQGEGAAELEREARGDCRHDPIEFNKYVDHEKETLLEVIAESGHPNKWTAEGGSPLDQKERPDAGGVPLSSP